MSVNGQDTSSKFQSQMKQAGYSEKKTKRKPKNTGLTHKYKIDTSVLLLPSNITDATESSAEIYKRLNKTGQHFKRQVDNGFALVRVSDIDGDCRIQYITADALRTTVEQVGTLKKYKMTQYKKSLCDGKCTQEDAKAILACSQIENLRTLDSIRKYPILALIDNRPKLLDKGYNSQLKVYIANDLPGLRTDLTIDEAVSRFENLFHDYHFLTKEDEARAFAALITPALRTGGFIPNVQHVPMFAVEADQSQAGKSLFVRSIAACYGEKCDIATQQNSGIASLEESITSSINEGKYFIGIDNYRGEMNSPFLEALLTETDGVKSRVAFERVSKVGSRNVMFFITSNGMKTKGNDCANRMCIIQIQKREKDYCYREYEEGGLDAWAKAKCPYFLSAIYSIITKHFENGSKLSQSAGGHSFQYWAKLLNAIITETMGIRITHIMTGHSEAQARVGNDTIRLLNELASVVDSERKLENPLKTEALVNIAMENNITIPSERGPIAPTYAKTHLGRLLKPIFSVNDTITLQGGYTIERTVRQEYDNSGSKKDRIYYTFYSRDTVPKSIET